MNLKGLMTVILKVLAIYILIQSISIIQQFFGAFGFITHEETFISGVLFFIGILLTLIIYFLIAWLLIVKTDWIVQKIIRDDRLEADFTTFKIHRSAVLTISIIVIGGLTLIDVLPRFIKDLYDYNIKSQNFREFVPGVKFDYLILSFIKILIGLYLIYYNRFVVNLIEKKRKK